MKQTVVVIPAFNEAPTIRSLVTEVIAQGIDRLIVVDDSSQDDTADALAGLPIHVIVHPRNQGKGYALMTGMQNALASGCERVITMDGDGQHRAADLPRLLAVALDHPQDLVIAARLRRREQAPPLRRFANRSADFWISWACGRPIADTQSGFRVYPASLLARLPTRPRPNQGFAFETELLIDATTAGTRLQTVPIDTLYCPAGRASHYRPWQDTWSIIRLVGAHLLRRGLFPLGLLGALGRLRPVPPDQESQPLRLPTDPHRPRLSLRMKWRPRTGKS